MNIFKRDFDQLSEKDKELLYRYFKGFDYRGAGYTFLANYIWRTTYCLCWEEIDDYMCMAGADCLEGEHSAVMSFPFTKSGTYQVEPLREAILKCKQRFDQRKIPFEIALIPETCLPFLREAFGEDELVIEHSEDDDEYVYEKEKLISLSGRKLHKKKNHLNYFLKTYDYQAKKMEPSMYEDILSLVSRMKEARSDNRDEYDSLAMEEEAIVQMLEYMRDCQDEVYSIAIYIDGNLEAFSLGERLNETTAVAHFEKANDSFRGLYQLVCREFCKILPEEVILVNREEDMGHENLRQAKEALRPIYKEKKYFAYFKK